MFERRVLVSSVVAVVLWACGSGGSPDLAGQPCKVPGDCYPGVDTQTLKGAVQCLDRVPGGYCTHLCAADTDCCAVPGECKTTNKQVCAPFTSTGMMMCFLSCEKADLKALPDGSMPADENAYCRGWAGAAFTCRSTGGGSQNRKVCVPQ
jgi:hypothetical protein